MSTATHDIKEIEKRMRASIDALKREFSGLRTGRASANLLDPVQVFVYVPDIQMGRSRHMAFILELDVVPHV